MKKNNFLILLGLTSLLSAAAFTFWYYQPTELISPLNEFAGSEFIRRFIPAQTNSEQQKVIYGFLPYWNLNQVQLAPQVTHLAYFGLSLSPEGKILTEDETGSPEPGYQKLSSDRLLQLSQTIKQAGGQFELVLTLFDNEDIAELVNSPQSQQNLLQSLDSLLLAYPIDGINLDLEYNGTVDQVLRDRFTEMVVNIDQHLETTHPQIKFSLDFYAGAASKQLIWDLAQLEPYLDYMIVMAYDFHRPNSPQAGPVAPLFGGEESWEGDINQHLAKLTQLVPQEKILLGIPFYGYQWQTTTREAQAKTYPQTGQTMELNEVEALLNPGNQAEYQVKKHWHQAALSPYLTYQRDGKNYVVYYENGRSLSYKIDYANRLNLAGVAIWALGYEDAQGQLWQIIEQSLE